MAKSTNTPKSSISIVVVKKCQHCSKAMYIRKDEDLDPVFIECEPCIVDIRLEKVNENEMLIKGKQSNRTVRCSCCKRKHLLSSFEEVKDGISGT